MGISGLAGGRVRSSGERLEMAEMQVYDQGSMASQRSGAGAFNGPCAWAGFFLEWGSSDRRSSDIVWLCPVF